MAGLLDDYQFGGYRGQNAGLLDVFRMMQSAPMQNPRGFAENEPSPLDTAQWPQGPMGNPSVLPPQAQPTQGLAPQMQQPQQPGFGDRLSAGFQGFVNAGSPMQAIGNLVGGLATGERSDAYGMALNRKNQTIKALVSRGLDPQIAETVGSDPALLRTVVSEMFGLGNKTEDIKEFEYARKENPSLTFAQHMQKKKAVSGEYGMQPIYGTNEKGETVILQLGKSGDAKQSVMPPGVKISTGVEKVDGGDHWILYDRKTGVPVGRQEKNIEEKEAKEETGKDRGLARAALPSAMVTARRVNEKIDKFLTSEGFNEVFGQLDQYRPNWTMSDKGREALSRFKQLSGEAFLEGRTMLKGGGAITDFESAKAESAIARLERSLNEEDAKAALADFKDAVNAGLEKLRARAGVQSNTAAPAPATNRIRLNADGTIKQ
jgi:hypothetical protein